MMNFKTIKEIYEEMKIILKYQDRKKERKYSPKIHSIRDQYPEYITIS